MLASGMAEIHFEERLKGFMERARRFLQCVRDDVRLALAIVGVLALVLLAGCDSTTQENSSAPPMQPMLPAVARGHIRFVEGYAAGVEQASREGKPMLLFFTAQWCEFCHQMANEAFVQEQVVGLSDRFVCVLIDADREPEICRQFQVRGYPTIQFLSPLGLPLNRVVGKKPGHQLVMEMHAALQAVARRESPTAAQQR
jgi:thiol:disulfide interchange protein